VRRRGEGIACRPSPCPPPRSNRSAPRTPSSLAAGSATTGVEVMVYTDPLSQAAEALPQAPGLPPAADRVRTTPPSLLTHPRRVWGREPWGEAAPGPGTSRAGRRRGGGPAARRSAGQREYVRGLRDRPGRDGGGNQRALRGGEHVPAAGPAAARWCRTPPHSGPDRARRCEPSPLDLSTPAASGLRRPDNGDRARQPPGTRCTWRRPPARPAGPVT